MKANNLNNGDFISVGEETDSILPVGWNSALLGDILLHRKGKKPKRLEGAKWGGSVPYIDIEAFETGRIRKYADPDSSIIVEEGDVVIVWDGARCGHVGKAPERGALGSTLMTLTSTSLREGYLLRFLQLLYETINSNPRGTGIPHVDPELFWNLEMPLAPAEEQKRIVAKIEELLPKVDAVRERLIRVKEIMKRFRQSVLSAACSGHLTEDWRDQGSGIRPADAGIEAAEMVGNRIASHPMQVCGQGEDLISACLSPEADFPELPPGWSWIKLDQCFAIVSGEAFKKRDYSENGLRLLQIANVGFGETLWHQRNFLPEVFAQHYPDLVLEEADICLALNRPILANHLKVTILTKQDLPAILYQRVARLRTREIRLARFGYFYFLTTTFRKLVERHLQGTDQPYLNFSLLSKFLMPLPPACEQEEIIHRVEALFKIADTIEKRVEVELSRTEKMTQAILAKAFRGELVPTESELGRRED